MSTSPKYNKEEISQRVKQGEQLSADEEVFYLTEIVGLDPAFVQNAMAIAANEDPHTIID